MRDRQQFQELGVVVEHLLEMRHEPALVDRIARETAAEMIVNPALADMVQSDIDGGEITGFAGAQAGAPQKLEQSRLREFWRAARAAIRRIDHAAELTRGIVEFGHADRDGAGLPCGRGERVHQRRAVVLDLLWLLAEQPCDLTQHVDEGRFAIARGIRKIGAAPDRFAGGREEHGERPAALLAEMMQRGHVYLIDVGAFLAIDFDVDEQLVHHRRGGVVLEAFVRHHVAPVTGRIADRKQDRFIVTLRLRQRVGSPRPPLHGVVLVLEQIWACLLREAVLVRGGVRKRGHGSSFVLLGIGCLRILGGETITTLSPNGCGMQPGSSNRRQCGIAQGMVRRPCRR